MELTPIDNSDLITGHAYDPSSLTLHLRFKSNGSTYAYQGITPQQDEALLSAGSIGGHFMREIRSKYRGIKISY